MIAFEKLDNLLAPLVIHLDRFFLDHFHTLIMPGGTFGLNAPLMFAMFQNKPHSYH